ncbi:MAG: hypothetical protein KAI38_04035 [Candidatus Latescibacteria bacterium]|nr:hypothetical protein [Candidatus Latescibacterota bacterium]
MPRKTLKNKGKRIGHGRTARRPISVSPVFPFFCFLFSCILGCAKSESPPSVEDLTEEAKAALEAGDYEAAVERFEELCGHSPDAALGPVGLGLCFAKMDCLDRAVIYLEQAIAMDAYTVDGHAALSVVYSALNRDAEAIPAAQESLELLAAGYALQFAPLITEWHIRTALMHSYFRMGAYPEAQAEAERISGLDFEDTIRLSDEGDRWIVEGTSYSTYEGALLAFIEDVDLEE